jgi:hypothetical protein
MTERVLVCRTAWMHDYQNITASDRPRGGGAWVKEHGWGSEIFNFRPLEGWYYGYARTAGSTGQHTSQIKLERLGGSKSDDTLQGVTVFWVATDPTHGGMSVVGWYDDATVFRRWQPSSRPQRRLPEDGGIAGYVVRSRTATLVPPDDRMHAVPRAKAHRAGMGQSNIWYPPASVARRLLRYAGTWKRDGRHPTSPRKGKLPRLHDTEKRLRIEKAAMEAVAEWCRERGYACRDVSLRKLGWDLEARKGRGLLLIEVKGSSARFGEALLELTSNEYTKMRADEHRPSYRLAVVSMVTTAPSVLVFSWNNERNAWTGTCDEGRFTAELSPVTSARVRITKHQS